MGLKKFPNCLRMGAALAAFVLLWGLIQSGPAIGNTKTAALPADDEAMMALEHVLVSAEYRDFIADQYENAEDMFAGHRGCTDYRLVARIGTEIRQPPEVNPETGKLTEVDLFDKWETERCGQKLQQNFALWIVGRQTLTQTYASEEEVAAITMADLAASFADDNSVTLIDFTIPGSTLATDEMVANIIARVLDDAESSHFIDCLEELLIVDTKFAEEVEKIRRDDAGVITKGKWGEYWTVYGCGREVQYPVIITKSQDGFGIEVFAKDAHQRDF
ncbi:MAG: hypothetical protein EP347_02020 [Alphaproteobacteria bacterium]|nr:MAG: hypothetical protein EP347_02020 [Alphaproteobacteria bacterium]